MSNLAYQYKDSYSPLLPEPATEADTRRASELYPSFETADTAQVVAGVIKRTYAHTTLSRMVPTRALPFSSVPTKPNTQYLCWKNTSNWNVPNPDLIQKLQNIFREGKYEIFEDGMHSTFSRALVSLINAHGSVAIDALATFLIDSNVNPEVASEALRWLGQVEHTESYNRRLWLLERSLRSPEPAIRDGAILGLSFLDDPLVIPALWEALQTEEVSQLRKAIRQVLEQLKNTQQEFESSAISDSEN
jgi:hypothetical protein